MSIKKVSKSGKKISMTLEMKLDNHSMLQIEENIEKALNEAGIKLSELALKVPIAIEIGYLYVAKYYFPHNIPFWAYLGLF